MHVGVTHIMYFDEPPGQCPFSGAEHHLFELAQSQVQAGLDVELAMLVYRSGPQLTERISLLEQAGVRVRTFAFPSTAGQSRLRKLQALSRYTHHLKTFLESRRDRIIHTHLEHAELLGKVASWRARCRHLVTSVHNNEPHDLHWPWRGVLRVLTRITRHYIAISDAVRKHMQHAAGIPDHRISTIHYGVRGPDRLESREALRQRLEIAPDAFVVGFVGRLVPQKNVPVLLDAMSQCPEAQCVVAGDGPQRRELQQRAQTRGLSNVHFAGHVPQAAELMPAFDVLCLPSRWEGLGLVLLEAMLRGVPIIGSRAGAIPEILDDGRLGMLFEPDRTEELVKAIRFAQNHPRERRQLAETALQYARTHYLVEHMLKRTTDVYERVLRSG